MKSVLFTNYFKLNFSTIFSIDTPSGTGDHENYFHRKERVLDIDGKSVFEKCKKKAAVIRERITHMQWFATDFTFLFSNETNFGLEWHYDEKVVDPKEIDRYSRALHPDYGYVTCRMLPTDRRILPMVDFSRAANDRGHL